MRPVGSRAALVFVALMFVVAASFSWTMSRRKSVVTLPANTLSLGMHEISGARARPDLVFLGGSGTSGVALAARMNLPPGCAFDLSQPNGNLLTSLDLARQALAFAPRVLVLGVGPDDVRFHPYWSAGAVLHAREIEALVPSASRFLDARHDPRFQIFYRWHSAFEALASNVVPARDFLSVKQAEFFGTPLLPAPRGLPNYFLEAKLGEPFLSLDGDAGEILRAFERIAREGKSKLVIYFLPAVPARGREWRAVLGRAVGSLKSPVLDYAAALGSLGYFQYGGHLTYAGARIVARRLFHDLAGEGDGQSSCEKEMQRRAQSVEETPDGLCAGDVEAFCGGLGFEEQGECLARNRERLSGWCRSQELISR